MTGPYLRPASVGWMALGGMLGSAAREALVLVMPDAGPLPWAIIVANMAGAFLLGFLYEALSRHGVGAPRGPRLRLLLGTGFCGGFTTYSTLAVGVVALAGHGTGAAGWAVAAGYGLGTVLAGAAATWSGIALGGARRPGREPAEFAGGGRR
ncbi:fluoride efflux transporter FluC [Specibacter sp. RAF43]|uniref:fluoride efflux transporter FluC n=1 Tax=Specibacter sp. RAF43 TaxID=3233057 RepID=UPI003F968F23